MKTLAVANSLQLQLDKQAMLSGKSLVFRPLWAIALGGLAEARIVEQLKVRSVGWKTGGDNVSVRFSYTRLQEQLPFFTRRWIIKAVNNLESIGAITVDRGARVNQYFVNLGNLDPQVEATKMNTAGMLVFPELAIKVGLLDAIALQQIHLRSGKSEGSSWAIRSLAKWHQEVFMFVSEATVKRLFSRLKQKELVFVGSYNGATTGEVKKYRVNYVRVAELLGIPVPNFSAPNPSPDGYVSKDEWINPLFPFSKAQIKKMAQANGS